MDEPAPHKNKDMSRKKPSLMPTAEDIAALALTVQRLQLEMQHPQLELKKAEAQLFSKAAEVESSRSAETQASTEQEAIAPNSAQMEKAAKVSQPKEDETLVKGNRVTLTWDRIFRWHTRSSRMPRSEYEGRRGTIIRTTKEYVWVQLDGTNEELKKKKHNVALVTDKH
jgi:hypothetical protein